MASNDWIEVNCTVPAELAEDLADFLLELTGNGVSIENRKVDTFNIEDLVEESSKSVKAYLPAGSQVEKYLARIDAFLLEHGGCVSGYQHSPPVVKTIQEEDWANSWKENFRPTRIGRRLVIKPSWEDYRPEPSDVVLELDPGMAFGTGTHATTRLCLEALERLIDSNSGARSGLLDVGCGSGVLGIAAALLGVARVVAVDIDPLAVTVTKENAASNGVAELVEASTTLLAEIVDQFPLVVANILAEDLVRMRAQLTERLAPGGFLVLSGILAEREEFVINGFGDQPLQLTEVTGQEEWRCIVLRLVAV